MSQDIATTERPRREYAQVVSPVSVFDTARFEHLMRIATVMARCSLIPESLYATREDGKLAHMPFDTVVANCFLVVSYAERIGFDPFLVAQSCSVVRGRLMFEGKLVAAALDAKLGVELSFAFGTWDAKTESCDIGPEGQGDALAVRVSGRLPGNTQALVVDGSVGTWKTSGDKSPWRVGAFKRMLRYRGAREWARAHKPSIMLGVITDDEMDTLAEDARARRATTIGGSDGGGLAARLQQSQTPGALPSPGLNTGFSMDKVQRELETVGRGEAGAAPRQRKADPAGTPEGVRDSFAGRAANIAPAASSGGGDHVKEHANAGASRETTGQDKGSAQTPADPGATSAGGEEPVTDSEISPAAPGETEDGNASRPSPPQPDVIPSSNPSMSAEMFRSYSLALARATKGVSLTNFGQKAGEAIIASLGGKPGPADVAVVQSIFALHEQRIAGAIPAAEIADLVDGLVEQHLGGTA